MKLNALAIVAASAFAASTVFAGDACCAKKTAKSAEMGCANYASLNLTAEQKTRMDELAAECHKGGCNEATMARMSAEAEKVLTKEQFAAWKAGHSKSAGKQS